MRYLLALLLLICAGCEASTPDLSQATSLGPGTRVLRDDIQINWRKVGPMEHLHHLQTLAKEGVTSFTIWNSPPKGWIKKAEVLALQELIDSTEPAAHVKMAHSSHLPKSMSTVGQQARFLIRGYKEGRYPPALHSEERR